MTGFIASVFTYRNRVSFSEAFEGLEPDEAKVSRPVLRGPGPSNGAWLLGNQATDGEGFSPPRLTALSAATRDSHPLRTSAFHGAPQACDLAWLQQFELATQFTIVDHRVIICGFPIPDQTRGFPAWFDPLTV